MMDEPLSARILEGFKQLTVRTSYIRLLSTTYRRDPNKFEPAVYVCKTFNLLQMVIIGSQIGGGAKPVLARPRWKKKDENGRFGKR